MVDDSKCGTVYIPHLNSPFLSQSYIFLRHTPKLWYPWYPWYPPPYLGLVHAHGAIFHMEHDGHVSVAGILVRPLRDRLLEEAVEAQDLRF